MQFHPTGSIFYGVFRVYEPVKNVKFPVIKKVSIKKVKGGLRPHLEIQNELPATRIYLHLALGGSFKASKDQ